MGGEPFKAAVCFSYFQKLLRKIQVVTPSDLNLQCTPRRRWLMAVRPHACNEGSRRGFLPGVLWFTDPTWEIGTKLATPGTGLQEGSDRAGRVPGAPGGAGLGTRSTFTVP